MAIAVMNLLGRMNSFSQMSLQRTNWGVSPLGSRMKLFRMPQLHLPAARCLSQGRAVKLGTSENRGANPINIPLKVWQELSKTNVGLEQKALFMKYILAKDFTPVQLMDSFGKELLEENVLIRLLEDENTRKKLAALAVIGANNPLQAHIHRVLVASNSSALKYNIAYEMTAALFASPEKEFNSDEILLWIDAGISNERSMNFAKDVLKLVKKEETPFLPILDESGRAVPTFPEDSWEKKLLLYYQGHLPEHSEASAKLAWALYLKLPIDKSLHENFCLIPKHLWVYFFNSMRNHGERRTAFLGINQFVNIPVPALKEILDAWKSNDDHGKENLVQVPKTVKESTIS